MWEDIDQTLNEIITNIGKDEEKENLKDLKQDLLLQLIEKEDYVRELIESNKLKFYLTRIVLNNIRSNTSRYYYKYKIEEKKLRNYYEKTKYLEDSRV